MAARRPRRQRTRARPTGAARRGSPRCRRSTRWISPAPGLNDILAEFESHWLGREVEGEQYLPAEAAFFRDIVSRRCARAAHARSADRRGAGERLAAQAHRGDPARGAARRRLRARASQRCAGARRRVGICRCRRTLSSSATKPAWSMPCSTSWRARLRAAEFDRAGG